MQAGAISLLAYVTDYYVVPRRFTPGFDKSLLGPIYVAISPLPESLTVNQ
jgi:hypothetical protein